MQEEGRKSRVKELKDVLANEKVLGKSEKVELVKGMDDLV